MTKHERMEAYFQYKKGYLSDSVPVCNNCNHFHLHYVAERTVDGQQQFVPTASGHCVFPQLKHRKVYDWCEHHAPREEGVGGDVTAKKDAGDGGDADG